MKRKLFALLLSGLAISLLTGAGVEEPATAAELAGGVQTAELSTPVEEPVDPIQAESATVQSEAADVSITEEQADAAEVDASLLVDGQPAPQTVCKSIVDGVTYVSLKVMSQLLDPTAQVSWEESSGAVIIAAEAVDIHAVIGQPYLIANGRYLYIPEGVRLVSGQSLVPLKALTKAFGAEIAWDESTQTVRVTTGAEPLEDGETYYNADDLFWLSRVIYAESGTQSLKGQMAVGNVVMNRVRNSIWPDTIFGVISQRYQFSTYKNGTLANRTPDEESIIAAKLVLDGAVIEEVADAYFFDSARSSWASRNKTCVAVIGGHRFFDY